MEWKEQFTKCLSGISEISLLTHLNDIIKKYNIPLEPFYDLIQGMEDDLNIYRYQNFDQLYTYCYRAAGTIAKMGLSILGYKTKYAPEYAMNLAKRR